MAAPRLAYGCVKAIRSKVPILDQSRGFKPVTIGPRISSRYIVSTRPWTTVQCHSAQQGPTLDRWSLSSAPVSVILAADFSVSSARNQSDVTSPRTCWKCGNSIHPADENFFCRCGVIMPPRRGIDYFQLFNLNRKFGINEEALSVKFKEFQRNLHPDKFTQKSEVEQQYSADQSSLVNKAFKTLIKPLSRGLYLLELSGRPIDEKTDNTALEPEFLMEIMEINEALADTDSMEKVQAIGKLNQKVLQRLMSDLSSAFDSNDITEARKILIHLKYYDNIDGKVKDLERSQFGGQ